MGSTQKKHIARARAALMGEDYETALAAVEAEAARMVAAGEAPGFLAAIAAMHAEFEAAGVTFVPRPNPRRRRRK